MAAERKGCVEVDGAFAALFIDLAVDVESFDLCTAAGAFGKQSFVAGKLALEGNYSVKADGCAVAHGEEGEANFTADLYNAGTGVTIEHQRLSRGYKHVGGDAVEVVFHLAFAREIDH